MFSIITSVLSPLGRPGLHKKASVLDCAGLITSTVLGILGLVGVHYAHITIPPVGNWLMAGGGLGGLAFLGFKKVPSSAKLPALSHGLSITWSENQ